MAHVHAPIAIGEVVELKNFGKPDEVREFPKGRVELVNIGGATIGRAIFDPGWRWSTSVQPIAKTKSCEAPHFQYHVSGVVGFALVTVDGGRAILGGQVVLRPRARRGLSLIHI